MPRRECTVQDSLDSYPKNQSERSQPVPTAWSSLVWLLLGVGVEDVLRVEMCGVGGLVNSGLWLLGKCLAGFDLWTLCKSWILDKLPWLVLAQLISER